MNSMSRFQARRTSVTFLDGTGVGGYDRALRLPSPAVLGISLVRVHGFGKIQTTDGRFGSR